MGSLGRRSQSNRASVDMGEFYSKQKPPPPVERTALYRISYQDDLCQKFPIENPYELRQLMLAVLPPSATTAIEEVPRPAPDPSLGPIQTHRWVKAVESSELASDPGDTGSIPPEFSPQL